MRRESGFTLMEMMIVVLLIGILSAVGIIRLSQATGGFRVEAAKEKLIQELRNARTEALARNCYVDLVALSGTKTFNIRKLQSNGTTVDTTVNITKQAFPIADTNSNIAVTFSSNLNKDANNNNRIIFDSWGKITNVNSGSSATLTITGSKTVTINVYKDTGYIQR